MKALVTLILGLLVTVAICAQENGNSNRTNRTTSRNSSSRTSSSSSTSSSTSTSRGNSTVVSSQSVKPENNTQQSTKNPSFTTTTPLQKVESGREHTYGNPQNPQKGSSTSGNHHNGGSHNNQSNYGSHQPNNSYGNHQPNHGYGSNQPNHGYGSHQPNHNNYGHGMTSPAGAPMHSYSHAPRPNYGNSFPYNHVFRPARITTLRDYYVTRSYGVTTTLLVGIYGISDIDVSRLAVGLPSRFNVINEFGTFERRYVEHADLLLAVRSVGYNYRRQMEYVLELIDLHDYSLIATWSIDNFFTKEEWNIERCISNNRYEIQQIMTDWDRMHY